MNDPSLPDLPLHIDSTMLSTFRACPKKFEFEYIHRLRPRFANIHLHAGGAFAAALEAWREAHYIHGKSSADAQLEALRVYILYYADFPDDDSSYKNFFTMMKALSSYMDTYPLETDHIQPLRPGSFEYSFAIPTRTLHPSGVPFMFCGRIDLLGTSNGFTMVCDEKTTSALGPSFVHKWKMRGQFLGYLWALKQIGIEASRALVRGTAIHKYDITHMEVPNSYPPHLIDIWADEMEITLGHMVHCWENNHHPRNFADTCSSFSSCPYQLPCSSKNSKVWFGEFIKNEWNPLLRNPIALSEPEIGKLLGGKI